MFTFCLRSSKHLLLEDICTKLAPICMPIFPTLKAPSQINHDEIIGFVDDRLKRARKVSASTPSNILSMASSWLSNTVSVMDYISSQMEMGLMAFITMNIQAIPTVRQELRRNSWVGPDIIDNPFLGHIRFSHAYIHVHSAVHD